MGGTQSRLHVYFGHRDDTYGSRGYHIDSSTKISTDCINFEVVTHKITIPKDPTYFDIYLYKGRIAQDYSDYIFAYCSPSYDKQVVENVNVYYSILAPDVPLVISFFTRGRQTYNCSCSELMSVRWDYASKITKYNFGNDLPKKLAELYRGISLNKTIQFLTDKSVTTTISKRANDIDASFKRWIYTPTGPEDSMGINDLFTNIKPSGFTNQLDYSYVTEVKDRYFDGIVVYCTKDGMALLLEFYQKCETKQYVRKDKDATYWAKEETKYNNYTKLIEQLNQIKEKASKYEIVTYILDRFDKYNSVQVDDVKENKNSYTKYTHKPESVVKDANFVFGGKKIEEFDKLIENKKPKTLDVYYLKVGNTKDALPFLLVLNENEVKNQQISQGQLTSSAQPLKAAPSKSETSKKSCYHLGPTNDFKNWQELSGCKSLDEKLKKIEDNAKCHIPLHIFRSLVYKILIEKEPEKKEEPPDTTEQRPDLTPEEKAVDTSLSVILGSVVAGLVVLGTIGAIIYGIYWYNTTIKLLT